MCPLSEFDKQMKTTPISHQTVRGQLRRQADPAKAVQLKKFFKTGKGQYGEGDQFLGITVPDQRAIAKQFGDLSLPDISELLHSPIHEERLTALLILVSQFQKADAPGRAKIYEFYLKHAVCVNNWDLVDSSAHHIVGAHLHGRGAACTKVLARLAKSELLWERRIAMVATWHSIQQGDHEPALTIAAMLLKDEHDLMHKAVGWMLREVGKRVSRAKLEAFLGKYHRTMPRTALRYAIEHLPESQRRAYLRPN